MLTRSAPAATLRNSPKSKTEVGLPTLRPTFTTSRKYAPIPRRYEETQPVIVKDFGHRRILTLGLDVHQRLSHDAEQDREQAVKETEERVWAKAEEERTKALEVLTERLHAEMEVSIAKVKKEQNRILQERLLETETLLRRQTIEAVEKEREEAKERLDAAVESTAEWWSKEAVTRETKARQQERAKVRKEMENLRKTQRKELQELEEKLREEKRTALEALARENNEELNKAVMETKVEEHEKAQKLLEDQEKRYERQSREFLRLLEDTNEAHAELLEQLRQTEDSKREIEEAILAMREELSSFIHKSLGVAEGQADHLLPSSKMVAEILARKLDREDPLTDHRLPESRASSIGTIQLPTTLGLLNKGLEFQNNMF